MKKGLGLLLLLLLALPTLETRGAIFYVDPVGDDQNDGLSPRTAWKSCGRATEALAPGDTLLFRRGGIWKEQLRIYRSGSASSPIVLSAYGRGPKPVIQPTTTLTAWSRVEETDVFSAPLGTAPTQVFQEGAQVLPAHWPARATGSPPQYASPTASSARSGTLTDSSLCGFSQKQLLGASVAIFDTDYSQNIARVIDWDQGTCTLTMADEDGKAGKNISTHMRYYLVAPPGLGVSYAGKSWMMGANSWFYDSDAQLLYLQRADGKKPGSVEAATGYGIVAKNASYITIDGLAVRYANRNGIFFENGPISNVMVQNCEIGYIGDPFKRYAGFGIFFQTWGKSTASNIQISNNRVDHAIGGGISIGDCSGKCTIDANVVTNTQGPLPKVNDGAIFAASGGVSGTVTINGNTISNSSYHGIMNQAAGTVITNNTITNTNLLLSDGGGIYSDGHTGGTIAGNVLTNTGQGIYCDERSRNFSVTNNIVTGGERGCLLHRAGSITVAKNRFIGPFTGDAALRIASDHQETHTIAYNIIVRGGTQAGIYLDAPAGSGINIYNNDLIWTPIGLYISAVRTGVVAHFENNLLVGNTTNVYAGPGGVATMDHNLYYGGNWHYGRARTTFPLWKKACAQDSHSLNANPMFAFSPNDFHLSPDSPAINAGAPHSEFTSDFDGKSVVGATDIGAYEFQPFWGQ